MNKSSTKLMGSSIAAAFTASLCCIAPLLSIVGGATGVVSVFSWVEHYRPYLIGITIAVLALAWFQRLKSRKLASNCGCEPDDKLSFWRSNKILLLVSCLVLLLLAFPNYAEAFYGQTNSKESAAQTGFKQTVKLQVKGMTCAGCEAHVNQEVGKVPGVFSVSTSYRDGNATVSFDSTRVKPSQILQAARKTGYTVEVTKYK